ncbi:alpha/beta family hydrolase [Leifsonia sp. PS1209]|uniref:alpha/beta hydrolase family protein n=1 Tax=Leifsonia sp. PS1209 TaxID=2724914 RepID=UPI001442AA1A|nr:alpha/beta family hydrolase [Leifsonia sp. PS1209]QIZ99232.1 hydrolase [Leifsonia sp. PS1209]
MRTADIVTVETTLGPGRLTVSAADADAASAAAATPRPRAVLWLGHGAGGGIEAVDLAALAAALPVLGITVVRYEQPWRVAGKRVASRPAALDTAWLETAPAVEKIADGLPILVGGRSAGARVACRTAASTGAAAVVCLAFPLHPPGRPDTSRLDELLTPDVPVLVLQGERDTFGTAATVAAETEGRPSIRVVPVPGADHGMRVLASSPFPAAAVRELLVSQVAAFVDGVV